MKENSLKEAFCCNYVLLGNVEEAALKAGFPKENALAEGMKCLRSGQCRKRIAEMRGLLADSENIIAGLKRLAFGSCSDAVYLVFADELPPAEVISRLDLFNVSEIKRVKGGGVEVKLFDRLKALEKLFELSTSFSDRDKASQLVMALISSGEDDNSDDT